MQHTSAAPSPFSLLPLIITALTTHSVRFITRMGKRHTFQQ